MAGRREPQPRAILAVHAIVTAFAVALVLLGTGASAKGFLLGGLGCGLVLMAYPAVLARTTGRHRLASPFVAAPFLRILPLIAWSAAVTQALPMNPTTTPVRQGALVVAVALFTGLYGAAAELDRRQAVDQGQLLDALVGAVVASSRTQPAPVIGAELRHETSAALFGIEAAAQSLSRHRDLLSPDQFAELSAAMVAEVERLRAMLDREPRRESGVFDLVGAVMPVVRCVEAAGLELQTVAPAHAAVEGTAGSAAQVALCLLENVRRHAPASPILLRVADEGEHVALYVEDQGPGVPARLRSRIFEPGVGYGERGNSGLGLAIARRLMLEQGGSIALGSGTGRGSTFVARFRKPRTGSRPGRRDAGDALAFAS